MSTDSPTESGTQSTDLPCSELDRQEGIQVQPRIHREPASHGSTGSFVVNDRGRDAGDLASALDDYREIPDGSAYQHARSSWYEADVDAGEAIELTTSYDPDWSDREDELGVTLTPSRSHAGEGTGAEYTAWYKYDLTIRQLDEDGEILDRAPAESLNLKLYPQVQGLVKKDGQRLELPHGSGTRVQVQTTWAETSDEIIGRALDLLEDALGYDADRADVNPESVNFWKAEAHLRVDSDRADDIVHTIRQSTDLLARHAAEVDESASYDGNKWLEAKIEGTEDWHKLGFPDLNVPILLKVYYPEDPDAAPYPFDQPKIEAAIAGKEKTRNEDGEVVRRAMHGDRLEEVLSVLREIVCSHLVWADVGPEDLVADEILEGPSAEPYEFAHPEGRRNWLRDHYESLVPEIYREATKTNTQLVYDILSVVQRRGSVSYEELQRETGAAYRTVRRHVSRLEEDVGGDEPGILQRVNDAVTFVGFSSRALESEAVDVLDEINADETIEDARERARERIEERVERQERRDRDRDQDDVDADDQEESSDVQDELEDEDVQDDVDADDREEIEDGKIWRSFREVDLTGQQLGSALDREHIDADDVEIRTAPYDWIPSD